MWESYRYILTVVRPVHAHGTALLLMYRFQEDISTVSSKPEASEGVVVRCFATQLQV
jgi:hypothetical protein